MKPLTLNQVYSRVFNSLKKRFRNPDILSRYLISETLHTAPYDCFTDKDRLIPPPKIAKIDKIVLKRLKGTPFEYIFGHKEFYGLDFRVTPAVMIPRYETELLCEMVLEEISSKRNLMYRDLNVICSGRIYPTVCAINRTATSCDRRSPDLFRIFDFFTGSGIIPVVLGKKNDYPGRLMITGFDKSRKVLQVAKHNARINGAKVDFIRADCAKKDILKYGFADIITANPPYIKKNEIKGELKKEPAMALDGGPDGLEVYRRFIPLSFQALKKTGILYTEIGCGQKRAVSRLLEHNGFVVLCCKNDYNRIPRILKAQKNG